MSDFNGTSKAKPKLKSKGLKRDFTWFMENDPIALFPGEKIVGKRDIDEGILSDHLQ